MIITHRWRKFHTNTRHAYIDWPLWLAFYFYDARHSDSCHSRVTHSKDTYTRLLFFVCAGSVCGECGAWFYGIPQWAVRFTPDYCHEPSASLYTATTISDIIVACFALRCEEWHACDQHATLICQHKLRLGTAKVCGLRDTACTTVRTRPRNTKMISKRAREVFERRAAPSDWQRRLNSVVRKYACIYAGWC